MAKSRVEISKEKKLRLYRKMYEIRAFEEKLYYLFLHENVPGTMHQYNGQEAVAVGFCENLKKDDYITSTHRGHGHCIAKGVDLKGMMAEMFGKSTGVCKGMGGSMHLADFGVGILGAIGIVGAGIPIATGAALSAKMRKSAQVTVCFFGDGAVNEGTFHEALNMAGLWKLPVVYVIENNLYGFSTHIDRVTPITDLSRRADSYAMPGYSIDGNDIFTVYRTAKEAVERARKGHGPTLVECKTYRFKGHSRFEPANYRTKEELEEWLKKDPLERLKKHLLKEENLSEKDLEEIRTRVDREIDEAVDFAKKSPDPEPDDALKYIYA